MTPIREALDRLRQSLPAPTCRAIRQSDEAYCSQCGLRWSLGESRPECGWRR